MKRASMDTMAAFRVEDTGDFKCIGIGFGNGMEIFVDLF